MQVIVFFVVSSLIGAFGADRRHTSVKIIGGNDVDDDEFPFMASLTRRGRHFCGASIIGEKFLVSAGHCMCSIIKPSSVKAVVGSIYATEGQLVAVKEIILHPQYKCEYYEDDIALLELHGSVDKISVLPLNHVMVLAENSSVTVMGWGWNHEDLFAGQKSETLRKAFVNVISNERCQAWYAENNKKNVIRDTQLCAGHESGSIDACWADSGGPLIDESGRLVGVVSTGVGCGRPKLPGIYTRVSKYITWINSVIS